VSIERLTEIFENQRAAFLAEGTADADTRIGRIDRLQAMILDHSEAICAAVDTDFGNRPASLTMIADVVSGLAEMDYLRKNLARWMRPHRPVRAARLAGVTMEVRAVPRGVVGIIGPWNFPLQLLIQPAAAALAAGNRVLLRPSSSTPNLAALLASIAEDYFDPTELAVITSDIASGAEFGALPFDHLFFTGSTDTGRKIQAAAAANLTPVTLELGGKNPAVVARSTGLERAAGRIGAARMVNSGQTCLSPDLAFVPIESVERFVETVLSVWRKDYPRIVGNDQYVSIIDQAAYERITALIDDAAAKGATVRTAAPADEALPDAERRLIAPTIVTGVTPEMDIYTEEVFGPVLAVFGYRDVDEVIDRLNDAPSPLSAYWYGRGDAQFERFFDRTRSGSVNRNDFGLVNAMHHLPFGGVGESGMGAYHGKHGFDTFSHQRAVASNPSPFSLAKAIATPHPKAMVSGVARYAESQRKKVAKRLRGGR